MLKKTFKILGCLVIMVAASLTITASQTKPTPVNADVLITDQDNDGIINLTDARIISPPTTTSCPVCVDVNGDGTINQMDVDLVNYQAEPRDLANDIGGPIPNPRFDVNNDLVVDSADANLVSTYIGQTVTAPAFGLDDPGELTFGFMTKDISVKYKPGTTDTQKQAVITKYNLAKKVDFSLINTDGLESAQNNPDALQKQIATEPVVEATYKNHVGEVSSADTWWGSQWGHIATRIPQTWFTETTGKSSVKVAVIDGGIDASHYDHQSNISSLKRNFIATNPNDDPNDDHGHGTFISGIIGATVNNNQGIAGSNFNVDIVPLKACTARNTVYGPIPVCSEYAIGQAFQWVIDHDTFGPDAIKVVNMSFCLGYVNNNQYLTSGLIDLAYELQINMLAATGNEGRDDACYPARHPKVTSVGASNQSGLPTFWTSRDYDVKAPGASIVSTIPVDLDSNHNGVVFWSGTSFSTAYASGVAALCRAVAPINSQTRSDLNCGKFIVTSNRNLDAWANTWYKNCKKFDFNNNNMIGVADGQALVFRLNSPSSYHWKYDIYPVGGDGVINGNDLLLMFARSNLKCQ